MDANERSNGVLGSPFLEGLWAFETSVDAATSIPDVPLAEPSFDEERAHIGLFAGRDKILDVDLGPEGLVTSLGRFDGNRRRPVGARGVARAFAIPVSEAEQMLEQLEQALSAGIAAYQQTCRYLVEQALGSDKPAETLRAIELSEQLTDALLLEGMQLALEDRQSPGAKTPLAGHDVSPEGAAGLWDSPPSQTGTLHEFPRHSL